MGSSPEAGAAVDLSGTLELFFYRTGVTSTILTICTSCKGLINMLNNMIDSGGLTEGVKHYGPR